MNDLTEFKDILNTSNTYLKAHMGFYMFWQLVGVLALVGTVAGIYLLLTQLSVTLSVFNIM